MKLNDPFSKISYRQYPCTHCNAPVTFKVMTEIETDEDIGEFCSNLANRAECPACERWLQAPEVVTAKFEFNGQKDFQLACIPIELFEDPEYLDAYVMLTEEGVKTVFSHDELQRALEVHIRTILRRLIGQDSFPKGMLERMIP